MIPQTIPRSYQKSLSFRLLFTRLREARMSYSQMLQPKCNWKTLLLGSTDSDSGDQRGQMQFRGTWSAVRKGTDLQLPVSRNRSHNPQCFAGSLPITAHKYFIETPHIRWRQSTERRNSTFGWNYHKLRMQTHSEKYTNLQNSHTHNVQEDPKGLWKMFTYLYWRTWKPSDPFPPSLWFQRYWLSHVSLQVKKQEVFQSVPPISPEARLPGHLGSSSSSLKDSMYNSTAAVTGPITLLKLV